MSLIQQAACYQASMPVDMSKEFYACIPQGVTTLALCFIYPTEDEAFAKAEILVQEGEYSSVRVLKCIGVVEEQKKPVVTKRFNTIEGDKS